MDLRKLKQKVENYYEVDLFEKSRLRKNINAKRMFCYYARVIDPQERNYSFAYIGNFLGLHHASVMNHCNTIQSWVDMQDQQILRDFWTALGVDLSKDKNIYDLIVKQPIEDDYEYDFSVFNYYLNQIPKDKLDEALERIRAMVKGYNMIHGKDKGEIIYSGGIEFNSW